MFSMMGLEGPKGLERYVDPSAVGGGGTVDPP